MFLTNSGDDDISRLGMSTEISGTAMADSDCRTSMEKEHRERFSNNSTFPDNCDIFSFNRCVVFDYFKDSFWSAGDETAFIAAIETCGIDTREAIYIFFLID